MLDGKTIKSLKIDPKDLRDRSVLAFNPSDIEKVEITLDGKTWLAAQGANKTWTLEQPEKKDKIDTWAISGMLWSLKDLEWKSIAKSGTDPAASHLQDPQLIAQLFKKGEKDPIVLKAGWGPEGQKKDPPAENQANDKKEPEEKASGHDDKKTTTTISVSVVPHEEQNTVFTLDGAFVDRLRDDLHKLTEKK